MADEGQSTDGNSNQQTTDSQQGTPAVPADGQQVATPEAGETPPVDILGKNPTETPAVSPTDILGKVPEAAPVEQKVPDADPSKVQNVPDSYTPFQNAPEGFVMDQGTTQLFQKAGLTQDGAQALVEGLRIRQESDIVLQKQQVTNQHNENITMLKQDVEFGGMHYEQTLKNSNLGLNRINTLLKDDSLTKVLKDSNLETHPSILKLFSMIETWHGEKGFITNEVNSNVFAGSDNPMANLARRQANEIRKARQASNM